VKSGVVRRGWAKMGSSTGNFLEKARLEAKP
jgi:hypothetical protein